MYVDHSEIRAGKADELDAAARRLVAHVAASEPRALFYGVYFSDDRSTMTVVHAHPDNSSLEKLMAVIAPVLGPFRDLLDLRAIDLYGSANDAVVAQLRAKVDLLGGTVSIHRRVAGVEAGVIARSGGPG